MTTNKGANSYTLKLSKIGILGSMTILLYTTMIEGLFVTQ